MKRFSQFWALGLIMAITALLSTSSPASAGPDFGSDKMKETMEKRAERAQLKFENHMRETFAKKLGIDVQFLKSSTDSECVEGGAIAEWSLFREFYSLSYCAGKISDSFYGDDSYESAYVNHYVVDHNWIIVWEDWYPANIAGLDISQQGLALRDGSNDISFTEVKKGYTASRKSSTNEKASDGTSYQRTSDTDYAEATVNGVNLVIPVEPTVYIERRSYKYERVCVASASGNYCDGDGVKGSDEGTGTVTETKPGNGGGPKK